MLHNTSLLDLLMIVIRHKICMAYVFKLVYVCSGAGCGKPCQHQLSGCSKVCSLYPQRELFLPHPSGPQPGSLSGTVLSLLSLSDGGLRRLASTLLILADCKPGFSSYPVGGNALWYSSHSGEECDHLGEPLLHTIPRCSPLQGQHVWQWADLLWCNQGWWLA